MKPLRVGFLTSGSTSRPFLPILNHQDSGYTSARVPGYSGATATDFHRLPMPNTGAQQRNSQILYNILYRTGEKSNLKNQYISGTKAVPAEEVLSWGALGTVMGGNDCRPLQIADLSAGMLRPRGAVVVVHNVLIL